SNLDTGTDKLIFYASDNLEPQYYSGKSTLATATAISVVNGTITTGKNAALAAIPADPGESDDVGTPAGLSGPERGAGPPRLLPDAPQHRAIKDGEDSDWFRFTATSGKVYQVAVTGTGFELYPPYLEVFDGTTKIEDSAASLAIVAAGGWTAPTTGERWIGMS